MIKELETPASRKRRPDSVTPDNGSVSVVKRDRTKHAVSSPVDTDKQKKKVVKNDEMVEDILYDDYEVEKERQGKEIGVPCEMEKL